MRLATNKIFLQVLNVSNLCTSIGFSYKKIKGNLKSVFPLRFTLKKDEIFRLPPGNREFQVLSGVAWVTIDGNDIILHSGEKAELESHKDIAIISALGEIPLILEVF